MKGKIAILLVISMFLGILSATVTAPSTKTIDGDPSDWVGIPGADNTYVGSNGEGIWRDMAYDDSGNGSYRYPNCTHTSPAIPDNWTPDGYAYCYARYYSGSGGACDLMEFRVTGDASNLYLLLRFTNMCNQACSVEWNKNVHTDSRANATNFGKILAQVYIDKNRISGSGNTTATLGGNFEFHSSCAWEVVIDVCGDVLREYPRVQLADGTIYRHNYTSDCYANPDIYPSAIEMKIPYSEIGDPRGKTWRFMVVVGGYEGDGNSYRQVWATKNIGFMALFRFHGGEGSDSPKGNDPNIMDMAFTASKAEQESLLNSFSSLVKINKYQDIEFDESGNVKTTGVGGEISPLDKLALMAPWIAMAAIVIVASASVVLYRRRTLKNL